MRIKIVYFYFLNYKKKWKASTKKIELFQNI